MIHEETADRPDAALAMHATFDRATESNHTRAVLPCDAVGSPFVRTLNRRLSLPDRRIALSHVDVASLIQRFGASGAVEAASLAAVCTVQYLLHMYYARR